MLPPRSPSTSEGVRATGLPARRRERVARRACAQGRRPQGSAAPPVATYSTRLGDVADQGDGPGVRRTEADARDHTDDGRVGREPSGPVRLNVAVGTDDGGDPVRVDDPRVAVGNGRAHDDRKPADAARDFAGRTGRRIGENRLVRAGRLLHLAESGPRRRRDEADGSASAVALDRGDGINPRVETGRRIRVDRLDTGDTR